MRLLHSGQIRGKEMRCGSFLSALVCRMSREARMRSDWTFYEIHRAVDRPGNILVFRRL
jgi:hypothetical protein